jgi:tungstate transport system ATP-binding protein
MLPLTLTDVTVRRKGKRLLGPVTLTLDTVGITTVIGPNGSGKTTLLRVMHGIERTSAGTAQWAIPDARARAQQSYVFQTPILLRRSVADNLRYPLQLRGTPKAEQEQSIAHWAAKSDLSAHLHLPANRLSGGERQKLALARALITSPQVLFLDEPCANLDGHATREIETLLQDAAASGTKIILATHDMGQAKRLSVETIFLVNGTINAFGGNIINAPQTAELKSFLKGDIVT